MYKDKVKQRQAVREATQRYRSKLKGITVIPEPCDTIVIPSVIPEPLTQDGLDDMGDTITDCRHCNAMTYDPQSGMSCPRGKWATASKTIFIANINPNTDCQEP